MKINLFTTNRVILIFIFGIYVILVLFSCNKEGVDPPGPKNQEIDDTIFSQNAGKEYPLKIYIPKEYEDNKNLPVVYLLDGLLIDPTVPDSITFFEEVVGSMQNVGLKAILVAIGNKRNDRSIELLAQGCNGTELGFTTFYNFVTQELIPFIDNKYENDHARRTLIGHSWAGNFAFNALFREDPQDIIFHGYISSDPSECDVSTMEAHLDNMNFPDDAVLKIHLSKVQNSVDVLYNLLVARSFPWLYVDFKDYPNETHISVTRPSIRRGLKFIYGI